MLNLTTRNDVKQREMTCGDAKGVDGINTPQQVGPSAISPMPLPRGDVRRILSEFKLGGHRSNVGSGEARPDRFRAFEPHAASGPGSSSAWPADLPSVTVGDLSIALAQAVGIPGSGCGDRLLGGQRRIDDRGSASHVCRLEALHDWCVHLADLRRQLDRPI
jgi:hypothetical protein